MKKLLICLVLILLLGGCGKEVNTIDIDKTAIVIEKDLHDMKIIDDTTLTGVYNLSLDKMEKYVFKENDNGDWYAIIKTSDKALIKNEMEGCFEKIKEFNSNYSPERLEILENRVEKEIGDNLIYIISKDANQIYNNIINEL